MTLNSMKPETLEEAQERLRRQSALEREGFAQASEGQLVAERLAVDGVPEEGSPRQELLDRHGEERVRASVQDKADQKSVAWTRKAQANAKKAKGETGGKDAQKPAKSAKDEAGGGQS